jgi:hypothetical protein
MRAWLLSSLKLVMGEGPASLHPDHSFWGREGRQDGHARGRVGSFRKCRCAQCPSRHKVTGTGSACTGSACAGRGEAQSGNGRGGRRQRLLVGAPGAGARVGGGWPGRCVHCQFQQDDLALRGCIMGGISRGASCNPSSCYCRLGGFDCLRISARFVRLGGWGGGGCWMAQPALLFA